MKKILTIFICFIMCATTAYAKDKNDNYTLNFNGEKYTLLYSAKDKESNGYLNEYFKRRETYNTWSEMVAIHHFPNAYSPIDQVRQFREYLGTISCPSALTFDDKKNTAMIDFVMISEHRVPVILEFNIFKFEKSKECGSVAIQYAKRYSATTAFEIEAVKEQFEKDRKKMIVKVKNAKIPDVILKEIDKCKFETADTSQDETKTENCAVTPVEEEKAEETPSDDNKTDVQEPDNKEEIKEEIKEDKKSEEIIEKENKNDAEDKTNKSVEKSNITTEKTVERLLNEENNKETKQENTLTDNNENNINTKPNNKKAKEASYKIVNTKDDYVAKPRTKKELKEKTKQIKKEQKINAKKAAKKRAQEASKKLKGD